MSNKRLKADEREAYKKRFGIRPSETKQKKCGACYNYNQNVCSIHYLVTKANEVCDSFAANQIKVFSGGSVSPK
ncbi:hypothetical protein [Brevibacillus sp. HD1.4A]|uniref:hypothetical protein n=1 Tax=Brevibacillus sp. HD1.4A TaxID=2738978 RepID=UPI00156BADC7|nr:hypothetical protein [Brevibacillus sp. HD1.4A]NRQ56059.1 hypothetical protein [Brevibacillus sp. HD1.4A]